MSGSKAYAVHVALTFVDHGDTYRDRATRVLQRCDREFLGAVPITPREDVAAVVDAVAQVQPFWAQLTLADRARYLERAAQVLLDESDEVRDLICHEQGKPRNEAFAMEILPTIDALRWIARNGPKLLSDEKIRLTQAYLALKRARSPTSRSA